MIKGNQKLSINALKELFELNVVEKKTHATNYVLQVFDIKKCEQSKKGSNCEMCTATLSDSSNRYNGFILLREIKSEPLEARDIIRVTAVTPAKINNQNSRVFIIKNFELLSKGGELLGDPEMIKDEGGSEFPSGDKKTKVESNPITHVNTQDGSSEKPHVYQTPVSNCSQNNNSINDYPEDINDSPRYSSQSSSKMYTPLKHLTTFSKDFKILVRVLKKSDIKTFNSSPNKNAGTLFSFVVLDQEGYEMQVTCFNKAVNKFYDLIKENKIYEVIGGYVKINEKKFSSVKADYKVVVDENSEIIEKVDDGSIQSQKFSFTKLSEILAIPLYSVIDTIGYVQEIGEKVIKNTKNGEQPMKKVIISDTSGYKMELTLWRAYADFEIKPGQVVALKNVKVGEFNGRNISTFGETVILPDPNLKEAAELIQFSKSFKGEYKDLSRPSRSEKSYGDNESMQISFMKDVLESVDEISDKEASLSRIKATVTQIMHNDKNFYPGCPDIHCKKKLSQETYQWNCVACNKSFPKPAYYYTLSIRVKDCSFEHWIDIFGKTAENLLKISAEEYKDLLLERDTAKLKEITNAIEFKTFYFLVRPKVQSYMAVPKKKLYAYKIETVDTAVDSKRILKSLIHQLKK